MRLAILIGEDEDIVPDSLEPPEPGQLGTAPDYGARIRDGDKTVLEGDKKHVIKVVDVDVLERVVAETL
jgi:hypothetical protein